MAGIDYDRKIFRLDGDAMDLGDCARFEKGCEDGFPDEACGAGQENFLRHRWAANTRLSVRVLSEIVCDFCFLVPVNCVVIYFGLLRAQQSGHLV